MQKMKTVFVINRDDHVATSDVVPASAWVLSEGSATVKFDGTSAMVRAGQLFKRYDVRKGKAVPDGALPCEDAPDAVTGHWPHWVPVKADEPMDRWHLEAFRYMSESGDVADGTYELLGPKVQGNLYGLERHVLVRHGTLVTEVERSRDGIVQWLKDNAHEGIVFLHPDGRMAKVRRKDFAKDEVGKLNAYDGAFVKALI